MSFAVDDLREDILGIFADAHQSAEQLSEQQILFRIRIHKREKERLLYHLDGKRKRAILERQRSPEAKLKRHERYLRDRPAPRARSRAVHACERCQGPVSQGAKVCAECRFGLSKRIERDVLQALARGSSEREVAKLFNVSRSMVTRIKTKNWMPPCEPRK